MPQTRPKPKPASKPLRKPKLFRIEGMSWKDAVKMSLAKKKPPVS